MSVSDIPLQMSGIATLAGLQGVTFFPKVLGGGLRPPGVVSLFDYVGGLWWGASPPRENFDFFRMYLSPPPGGAAAHPLDSRRSEGCTL